MSTFGSEPGASFEEEDAAALLGSLIGGRYRVESVLGQGGMGAVYRVQHLTIRKNMAIKVLSRKMMSIPTVVARFEREATLAAHLTHPNVVSASDYGRMDDGRFYLVLEYVEGKELRSVLDQANGPLPAARAFYIARQIVSALSRAHALGIVHRDLKPQNIMLERRDGQDDFVRVLDFGLALLSRHLDSTGGAENDVKTAPKITKTGEIFGTPPYMSPEQTVGGATDIRTDLYAVGVLLYEMLVGVRPFPGPTTLAFIQQHLSWPAPSFRERAPKVRVAADIEALVLRLLAKQPADRFQTPEELLEAMDLISVRHGFPFTAGSSPSQPTAALPGGSSLNARMRSISQTLTGMRRSLTQALSRARARVSPKPRGKVGQAMALVRKRLGLPARKSPWRAIQLVAGGVVVATVLTGLLLWASKAPEAMAPQAPTVAAPSVRETPSAESASRQPARLPAKRIRSRAP